MNPIFVVVGPPAVGKSTTSRALAARFAKSIHIPVDNLRDMVISGVVLPEDSWSNELVQQIALARESAIQIARTYHQAGFVVVIDDFVDPHGLAEYRVLDGRAHVHKVVLLPSQSTAHERNFHRSGTSPARDYIDGGIDFVYHYLKTVIPQLKQHSWMVIDTSTLSVEATVATILGQ